MASHVIPSVLSNCIKSHHIPIVFHNLSGYDAHLFIRKLRKKFHAGKIGLIAENNEKYISCNTDVVVDSYTDDSGEVNKENLA